MNLIFSATYDFLTFSEQEFLKLIYKSHLNISKVCEADSKSQHKV